METPVTTLSIPTPLRHALRKSNRSRRLVSLFLIAPLSVYIAAFFVLPIGVMFYRAVANPEVREALPRTAAALLAWQPENATALPPDPVYRTLANELKASYGSRELGEVARRMNYEHSGFRTLFLKTARTLANGEDTKTIGGWATQPGGTDAPTTAAVTAGAAAGTSGNDVSATERLTTIDPEWGAASTWRALRRAAPSYTPYYLLAALDLHVDDNGRIARVSGDQRIYLEILARTFRIAAVVTAVCLVLGYLLAALMVKANKVFAFAMLLAVMLPFWTSLLARTTAWIVVLQENGLVNNALIALHIIDKPLTLIFNSTGLYIVMVHIMLPFTVLPIYTSMKAIPQHFMRASASLGGHPVRGFLHVYLPMTMPGVGAGALLTFIITIGYYITPSLVASAREQMLGYFIAFYANTTVNWGMSSALGIVLLASVALIYAIAARTVGIRQIAGLR
jgi:putative spermidine/putrescine transport system permease protein